MLLLLVGLLGIGTIVVLVLPATRPASSAEAAALVAAATIAGMGALGLSNTTDDAVWVDGETIYCNTSDLIGEGPLPDDVQDRCAAQRDDRQRQAWLAAGGAAWLAVGATCVVTAFGPLARRKDPDARLPLPSRRSHDGVAEEASSTPRPPATS